jgi:hypothetical protein
MSAAEAFCAKPKKSAVDESAAIVISRIVAPPMYLPVFGYIAYAACLNEASRYFPAILYRGVAWRTQFKPKVPMFTARQGGDLPARSAPRRSKAMRKATSPWSGFAYAQLKTRSKFDASAVVRYAQAGAER